ncbi:helix-turn-helix domain-containing protein [Anaeromassilibacillus sp. SJQ-5]
MNTRKLNYGDRNVVGRRVTEARIAMGLTQNELMARLQIRGIDISASSVSLLEGQRRPVFDYELAALADILKVDVNWLLGRQEETYGGKETDD